MNRTTKTERERLLKEAMRLVKAGLEPRDAARRLREDKGISWDRARRYVAKAMRRIRYEEMVKE